MKKCYAVYTGQGLSGPLQALLNREIPSLKLFNIIDDSIIYEVNQHGKMTESIALRLLNYFKIAQEAGADFILNTCSSVGEIVPMAQPLISKKIIRIDDAMAAEAVRISSKIGVIATLPTTLKPTMALLKEKAAVAGKDVNIVDGLASGAFQALVSGNPERHDELISEAASKLSKDVDCIVLAQGSMMRMQDKLTEETGVTVLSSPVCCVKYIKSLLNSEI